MQLYTKRKFSSWFYDKVYLKKLFRYLLLNAKNIKVFFFFFYDTEDSTFFFLYSTFFLLFTRLK